MDSCRVRGLMHKPHADYTSSLHIYMFDVDLVVKPFPAFRPSVLHTGCLEGCIYIHTYVLEQEELDKQSVVDVIPELWLVSQSIILVVKSIIIKFIWRINIYWL